MIKLCKQFIILTSVLLLSSISFANYTLTSSVIDSYGSKGNSVSHDLLNAGGQSVIGSGSNAYNMGIGFIYTLPFNQPPQVAVISPNGGEKWICNSFQNIIWTATDIDDPVLNIKIEYTANASNITPVWNVLEDGVNNNDGTYVWTVPLVNSTDCKIRVTASDSAGNVVNDLSDNYFSVGNLPNLMPLTEITGSPRPKKNPNSLIINAPIENNGFINATNVLVEIENINTFELDTDIIANIPPGQNRNAKVTFQWPGDGVYPIRVKADSNETIPELNEDDNEIIQNLVISGNIVVAIGDYASHEDFSNIYISFSSVSVFSDGVWKEVPSTGIEADLKQIHESNIEEAIGIGRIEPGAYSRIKLTVDRIKGKLTLTGEIVDIFLPVKDFELEYIFEVKPYGLNSIIIYLNWENSIIRTPSGWDFIPVIREIKEIEHSCKVSVMPQSLTLIPDSSGEYKITIINDGTVADNYELSLTTELNPEWYIISSEKIFIPAKSSTTVIMEVNIPRETGLNEVETFPISVIVTCVYPSNTGEIIYIPESVSSDFELTVIPDVLPPNPVTTLTVTGRPYGNIELNWSEVTDNLTGVDYYRIFRATYPVLGEEITTTEENHYTDSGTNLTDNIVYYYTVQPVDNVGNIQIQGNNQAGALCDKTLPTVSFISPSQENIGVCKIFNSTFPVIGTVTDQHLKKYTLAYAQGKDAISGFITIKESTNPVTENTLALWNTTVLTQNQYYTLKITAEDSVGNISTDKVNIFIGKPEFLFAYGYEGLHYCFGFGFEPAYIAIDVAGYSYVTDHKYHGRIVKFDSSGNAVDVFGGPQEEGKGKYGWGHGDWHGNDHERLAIPEGITLDSTGNMYVADRLHNRVVKLDPEGNLLMEIGGEKYGHWGKGQWHKWFKNNGNKGHEDITFIWPTGVVMDNQNNIWVADRMNNRLQKFTPEGEIIEEATIETGIYSTENRQWKDSCQWWNNQPFTKPGGLAIDKDNNLYVADQFHDRVLKYSPDGTLLLEIGEDYDKTSKWKHHQDWVKHKWKDEETGGTGIGQFKNPDGIVVDGRGYIYVTDQGNSRTQKFDKYGNFVMVWGTSGSNEGEFKTPGGITVDNDGKVYVVDRDNSRVQVFGLSEDKQMVASSKDNTVSAMGVIPQGGGKIVTTEGVELTFSSGAVAGMLTVKVTPVNLANKNKGIRAQSISSDNLLSIGDMGYKFEPEGLLFDKPITITIPYEETSEVRDVKEDNLKIFYLNEETSEWELIANSRVDIAANKVSADISHFSTYRVMGVIVEEMNLDKVANYPNPFSDGTVFIFSTGFTPDEVSIRIYTVSGRLIKEINGSAIGWGYNEIHWDGRDQQGNPVANGTYLYRIAVIKDEEKIEQVKKLVVIR